MSFAAAELALSADEFHFLLHYFFLFTAVYISTLISFILLFSFFVHN